MITEERVTESELKEAISNNVDGTGDDFQGIAGKLALRFVGIGEIPRDVMLRAEEAVIDYLSARFERNSVSAYGILYKFKDYEREQAHSKGWDRMQEDIVTEIIEKGYYEHIF